MKVSCCFCNCEFNKPPYHIKRVFRVFCSKLCYDNFQRQLNKIEKFCKICSESFLVRKCEVKKFSTCDKKECRIANKIGKNNPKWRGGITKNRKREMSTNKYKKWRLDIFIRDNYTCVFCGKRGGNLEADHIKPWSKFKDLRYDINNGRTLCRKCHITTFKENWKTNE
jgi:hypothetical protein